MTVKFDLLEAAAEDVESSTDEEVTGTVGAAEGNEEETAEGNEEETAEGNEKETAEEASLMTLAVLAHVCDKKHLFCFVLWKFAMQLPHNAGFALLRNFTLQ